MFGGWHRMIEVGQCTKAARRLLGQVTIWLGQASTECGPRGGGALPAEQYTLLISSLANRAL